MKAALVHNLHDWLPAHEESKFSFFNDGLDVHLVFNYEHEGIKLELRQRSIIFHAVSEFCRVSFPGAPSSPLCGEYYDTPLGSLVEIKDSPYAKAWTKHWKSLYEIKHYQYVSIGENWAVKIFATSFNVTDPIIIHEDYNAILALG